MCWEMIFLFVSVAIISGIFSFCLIPLFISPLLAWRTTFCAFSGICGRGNKKDHLSAPIWMLMLHLRSQKTGRAPVSIIVFGLQLWLPKCSFKHWHSCHLLWLIIVQRRNSCLWFSSGFCGRKAVKWFIPSYMKSYMCFQLQSFGLWHSMFLG